MLRLSLHLKLVITIAVLLILAVSSLSLFLINHEKIIIHTDLKERGLVLADSLAYNAEYGVLTANTVILTRLIAGVMAQPDVVYCVIRDINGKVLAFSGLENNVSLPNEIISKAIITNKAIVQQFKSHIVKDNNNIGYYDIAVPVKSKAGEAVTNEDVFFQEQTSDHERKIGVVQVGLSLSRIDILVKKVQTNITLMVIAMLLIAGMISVLLTRLILIPVKKLMEATKKVSAGDLNFKVSVKTSDEIGILADSFNKMIDDLQKITVSRDELIKAQEELRNSEGRFQDIAANTGEWIWELNTDGSYTYSSPGVEKVLGYKPQEVIGKYFYDFFIPTERDQLKKIAFEVFSQKNNFQNFVNQNIHKNGHTIILDTSGVPIVDTEGKLTGYRGVDRDITERKKAEEQLQQAYEQLKATQFQLVQSAKMASVGQLAGGVAHEINNPLTGVLNNVQLIKMESELKKEFHLEDFKVLLNVIEESALRCKKITESLLSFSRAATGKFVSISLNDLTEKVVTLINYEMKLQNITILTELQANLPQILGDPQLLQQIIFDLVGNAKWAIENKMPKTNGVITIKTSFHAEDKRISVSISDTGIGIPQENLEKIFEPFFTTKPVGEGTGLGLSIVYSIVKQHSGDIKVESHPGQGTTFKITLPVV
jgi:PAS domain S-box-containing protein